MSSGSLVEGNSGTAWKMGIITWQCVWGLDDDMVRRGQESLTAMCTLDRTALVSSTTVVAWRPERQFRYPAVLLRRINLHVQRGFGDEIRTCERNQAVQPRQNLERPHERDVREKPGGMSCGTKDNRTLDALVRRFPAMRVAHDSRRRQFERVVDSRFVNAE